MMRHRCRSGLLLLTGLTMSVARVRGEDAAPRGASSNDRFASWAALTGHAPPVRLRRRPAVEQAALSPNGKLALTASRMGSAILWDVESGAMLRVLPVSDNANVNGLAFLPDGSAVTAESNGTTTIWDVVTGEPVRRFSAAGWLLKMQISSDGRRIVTGYRDRNVRVWDVRTGKLIRHFFVTNQQGRGGTYILTDFSINSDASLLVTTGTERVASLWDVERGKRIRMLKPSHGDFVSHARLSNDGCRVVTMCNSRNTATLWNTASDQPLRELRIAQDGLAARLDLSRDGRRLLIGYHDNVNPTSLWDLKTGRILKSFGKPGSLHAAAFSHDEKRIIVGSRGTTADVYDVATTGKTQTLRGRTVTTQSIAGSQGGRFLLVQSTGGLVMFWDLQAGRPRRLSLAAGTLPAVSHDGSTVAVLDSPSQLMIWHTKQDRHRARISWKGTAGNCTSLAISRDGSRAVTGHEDGQSILWDTDAARPPLTLKSIQRVQATGISHNGAHILTGHGIPDSDEPGSAIVWDTTEGRRLHEVKMKHPVQTAAFSGEGKRFVVADKRLAVLCETASGRELHRTSLAGTLHGRVHINRQGERIFGYLRRLSEAKTDLSRELRRVFVGSRTGFVAGSNDSLMINEHGGDSISVFDVSLRRREILNLMTLDEGRDWLAWTPEGLYDGSENARQMVRFCLNGPPDAELAASPEKQAARLKRQDEIRHRNYFPGLMGAISRD